MDGIEKSLGPQTPVLRLSVRDAEGARVAARLGVRGVPTLIVWRDGEVLRQVGHIDKQAVIAALAP